MNEMLTKDVSPNPRSPFYLLDLPPNLLEKVLTKLPWQVYFKLRKTCKLINDFTRTSRNIRVYVDRNCHLLCENDDAGLYKLIIEFHWTYRITQTDVEDFYGIRFRSVAFPREISQDFEQFYTALKKYRITGVRLSLPHNYGPAKLTKKQCTKLFNFNKPEFLIMNTIGSNQLEAAFSLKNLKEVAIAIEPENALWSVENLLGRVEKMTMIVHSGEKSLPTESFFNLVSEILKLLRSASFPNLRSFSIDIPWRRPVPAMNQLLTRLREFGPVAKMNVRYQQERKIFLTTFQDRNGFSSEFIMNDFHGKIQYGGKYL